MKTQTTAWTLCYPSSVSEESSGTSMVFQLQRYDDTSAPLTVTFSLSGSATLGVDYLLTGATMLGGGLISVTFPANNYLAQFHVTPTGDTQFELDENLAISIVKQNSYVGEYATLPQTVAVTIADDDPADFGDAPAPYRTLDGGKMGHVMAPRTGSATWHNPRRRVERSAIRHRKW